MHELTGFGLLCFTSFFSLINPLGTMPIFMTMTSSLSHHERNTIARRALIVAFITLIVFAFMGQILFNFFGISVDSMRIVGGIIFFSVGYDMLQARLVRTQVDEEDKKKYISDISITPLAIPIICGPGAITNAIVLMQDAHSIERKIILVSAILVICFITYLVLIGSTRIIHLLGETGNKIMMRLMGLIVMVIAVEFFFSGLKPIVRDMLK
jgi:multiple antibiotic resistance protein